VSADPAQDRETRLQAILGWLEHGRITTEQAAARVRAIGFPVPVDRTPFEVQRDDAGGDHAPPEPGSFFAISEAFAAGRIDQEQYAALAQAAAEVMKRVSGT
jgi:hypothetical protein